MYRRLQQHPQQKLKTRNREKEEYQYSCRRVYHIESICELRNIVHLVDCISFGNMVTKKNVLVFVYSLGVKKRLELLV